MITKIMEDVKARACVGGVPLATNRNEFEILMSLPEEELDENDKAWIADWLKGLEDTAPDLTDDFAQAVILNSAYADALADESKRLAEKAKSIRNRISWMQHGVISSMRGSCTSLLKGRTYQVKLCSRERVKVLPDALMKLPDELVNVKTEITPNKTAIKDVLKKGDAVPGCSIEDNFFLQIK